MECNFFLTLCNGQSWELTASGDTRSWLTKMAGIMRLGTAKPADGRRIHFVSFDQNIQHYESYIPDQLPKTGWTARKMAPVHLFCHNDVPDMICNIGTELSRKTEYVAMNCSLIPVVEEAIRAKGVPFHSGLVVRDGFGVLLMAPSGVGKSTCCRRIPAPWQALSDDYVLGVRDKEGCYQAHPLPTWVDRIAGNEENTWDVQAHVPIKAIFLLEQSEKDLAIPISGFNSAISVYNSALRGSMIITRGDGTDTFAESQHLIFNNICDISRTIPAFKLLVSKNGKFWEEIERVI